MNKKKIFYQDQYYNFFKRLKTFFLYPEKKLVYLFRKAQYYIHSKNLIMKYYWSLKWLLIRKKGCQISHKAQIGSGLTLLHNGLRIIVGKAKIGTNCTIGVNVIIGLGYNKEQNQYMAPIIGNKVYIGHNSSIVGGITIGDNVLVAPNSYINKNVPNDCIVLGNNIIIPKANASEKYLKIA